MGGRFIFVLIKVAELHRLPELFPRPGLSGRYDSRRLKQKANSAETTLSSYLEVEKVAGAGVNCGSTAVAGSDSDFTDRLASCCLFTRILKLLASGRTQIQRRTQWLVAMVDVGEQEHRAWASNSQVHGRPTMVQDGTRV